MSQEKPPRSKDGADDLLRKLREENDRLHEEVKRLKETRNG